MSDATTVFQFIGGAIGIATAQNIFANKLVESLPNQAPGVDAASVLAVGVTGLRSAFSPSQLSGILALSAGAFVTSLLPGWKSIKAKKETMPDVTAASAV
jgi:hypothetical protein